MTVNDPIPLDDIRRSRTVNDPWMSDYAITYFTLLTNVLFIKKDVSFNVFPIALTFAVDSEILRQLKKWNMFNFAACKE